MTVTAAPPEPARRTPRQWLAEQDKRELALWGGLLALALVLRLYDLGARPYHHDESQHAYFSWVFAERGEYEYDPLLHGPLQFFLSAGVFTLLGDSDFTGRLGPALMGWVIVALPFLLRRQMGRVAAFAAALLFAIGPSFLYFSRFTREDISFAALSLGLIVAVWRYLDRPSKHGPAVILGIVAAMFATKETAFISMAVAGAFFIPAAFVRSSGLWAALKRHGWRPWAWGLVSFLVVWGLFFGVFFTQWNLGSPGEPFPIVCSDGTETSVPLYSGIKGGFLDGIDYWLAQQCVERGGEEPLIYPALLLGNEWPTVLLGLLGAAWALRHRSFMRLFLVFAVVGQLVIYMYASERFAWLVLHPLLPLVLLAGIGVQALWRSARARALVPVAAATLAVGLAGTAVASWQANVKYEADPREMLVSTQSATEVKRVVDETLARGPETVIAVDSHDGQTYPYAWYFRNSRFSFPDLTQEPLPDADVVIASEDSHARLSGALGGYDVRRFQFRVWWVRSGFWGDATPAAWWRYVTRRETFSPTGGLKQWLYVRR